MYSYIVFDVITDKCNGIYVYFRYTTKNQFKNKWQNIFYIGMVSKMVRILGD